MKIQEYRFGTMTVDNQPHVNDLKIIDGVVAPRWWRREGHTVSAGDVDDILAASPRYLVVGAGQPGRMAVDAELVSLLSELGIELIEEPTDQAIHTFNRLFRDGKKVAGAFHLTC
ncbi:MAG: Mth938-like domain-containing protein [Syntrophobacteraceae bacterium]